MKILEEQISVTLERMKKMIKNRKSKTKIDAKRKELDELLKKYLKSFN